MLLAIQPSSLSIAVPAALLLLGLLILICARLLRNQAFLYWCAIGHVLPGVAMALQTTLPIDQQLGWTIPVALLYMGGAAAVSHGMMLRFGGALPGSATLVVGLQTLVGIAICSWLIDEIAARLMMLICAIVALHALALPQLIRSWHSVHGWDRAIIVSFAMRAGFAALRAVYILFWAMRDSDTASILTPDQWQIGLTLVMLFSLWFAFCVVISAVRDEMIRLRDASDFDPLTGRLNRRGFFERAGQNIQMLPVGPWYILSCDVDHFKRINDTYGHATGDLILRHIGETLGHQVEPPLELVARFGGEEFVLLLQCADDNAAYLTAETIRQTLAGQVVPPIPYAAQASFGLTRLQGGQDMNAALARADTLLYEAKKAGRNQVVVDPAMTVSRHLGADTWGRVVPLIAAKAAKSKAGGKVA